MIVRLLESSAVFAGIDYNFSKIERGDAELLKACNFDYMEGLTNPKPQDYQNYLLAISARNKRTKNTQFHAAISTEGKKHDKTELTEIAEQWLKQMGYGDQPYLIYAHNDAPNNHVHILTSRIDKNGRKINDSFEKLKAVAIMTRVMHSRQENKFERELSYRFTTLAQFKLLLELQGLDSEQIVTELPEGTIKFNEPSQQRRQQLKAFFRKYPSVELLKEKFGIQIVFHAKHGLPAYGYTVIDHAQKNVFKGSQIMALKEFLSLPNATERRSSITNRPTRYIATKPDSSQPIPRDLPIAINISKDIDDEAIHGPRRNRKKKARTNQR
jgi:hypothetical protein